MRRLKLVWQLYPACLLLTLGTVLAMAAALALAGHRFYLAEARRGLEARLELVRRPAAQLAAAGRAAELDAWFKEVARHTDTRLTFIAADGSPLADSEADPAAMDNHADRPEVRDALTGAAGFSRRHSHTVGADLLYLALPLPDPVGGTGGVLRAARPVRSLADALRAYYLRVALGALAVSALAAFFSYGLTRWITRPLRRMEQGAARFARGDFAQRLHVHHSAEMDALAASLNGMAAQLDERFQTITRQQHELAAVLAGMSEGLVAVDAEGRILTLNATAAAMFGVDADTVRHRNLLEVVRNPTLHDLATRVLVVAGPVEADTVVPGPQGEIQLQVRGTQLREAGGSRPGAVLVLNDVTRLRRLENLRREFAANVSHELRTPITAIRGFVETLQDGALQDPAAAQRFLGIIAAQVERLGAIVEDLLLLSRLDQDGGAGALAKEPCPVDSLLRTVQAHCAAKARERDVTVQCEAAPGLEVPAASTLLQQAVANLLDNALNHSPAGGRVALRAWRSGGDVAIAVQDWGCGIAPEHLPRLFERFYRVDKARSREQGGTGLGLAIVKHIVQAHGGRVAVSSQPGAGSTFTLFLPV